MRLYERVLYFGLRIANLVLKVPTLLENIDQIKQHFFILINQILDITETVWFEDRGVFEDIYRLKTKVHHPWI